MIPNYCIGTKIYNEFSETMRSSFFDLKKEKFLHNIDTFYYSVFLTNDFSRGSDDSSVIRFRQYMDDIKLDFDTCEELNIPYVNEQLNVVGGSFSRYYVNRIECPDCYDIFICHYSPNDDTAQIIVQLRSNFIWMYGVHEAFNKSYEVVKAICEYFDFCIFKVQENRADFCWHTNYFDNPEQYFRIDNFTLSAQHQFRECTDHYDFRGEKDYEHDYMALGKRGGNCFIRIYLKSKEVVEMQYKAQFFYIWKLHNLINEYDFWVLSKAYDSGCWHKLDIYRLEFYLEYGKDEKTKQHIRQLLDAENVNMKLVYRMAELVVPKVTKIINIEFQVTHKSTRTYKLIDTGRNEGVTKRIYDFLDNHALICEYLTHSTLRFVDYDPEGSLKKCMCDYNYMWKRLRSTKIYDCKRVRDNEKLIREYCRKHDKDIVKRRLGNSVCTYSILNSGNNDNDVMADIADFISTLNDNDIARMNRYKKKRNKQIKIELDNNITAGRVGNYSIVNSDTGEIVGGGLNGTS